MNWLIIVLVIVVSCPVISFGRDGALLVTDDTFCLLDSLTIVEMNPTVAGDLLVAGVNRFSGGDSFAGALKFGIACVAATASCPETESGKVRTQAEELRQLMN